MVLSVPVESILGHTQTSFKKPINRQTNCPFLPIFGLPTTGMRHVCDICLSVDQFLFTNQYILYNNTQIHVYAVFWRRSVCRRCTIDPKTTHNSTVAMEYRVTDKKVNQFYPFLILKRIHIHENLKTLV